jgi:hypothetical protein
MPTLPNSLLEKGPDLPFYCKAVGVCFLHLSSFKIFPRRPDWLNPNGGRVVVCVVNAPNCRLPNTAMRRAVRLGVSGLSLKNRLNPEPFKGFNQVVFKVQKPALQFINGVFVSFRLDKVKG